jgi:hypothetical protein
VFQQAKKYLQGQKKQRIFAKQKGKQQIDRSYDTVINQIAKNNIDNSRC